MKKYIKLKQNLKGSPFKAGQVFPADRVGKNDGDLTFFTVAGEKYCAFMGEDCEITDSNKPKELSATIQPSLFVKTEQW